MFSFCYLAFLICIWPIANAFEPKNASVVDILYAVQNQSVKCAEIIQSFLDRIDRYDSKGPNLHAVIAKNPKAMDEARQLDVEFQQRRQLRGDLHCVPFLIKDNIDVAGMPTTAGTRLLQSSIPSTDSAVVDLVKRAGGIVVAKANMAPLASWTAKSESENGGLVRNSYGPEYSTFGSSGGNSAGGAAMYAVVGLGTETGMSINLPASAGNLVGARPLLHSVSTDGVLPAVADQDVVGPFAKRVEDVAVTLDVISGNYKRFNNPRVLDRNGLQGVRIGIFGAFSYMTYTVPIGGINFTYAPDPEVVQLFNEALANMSRAGAQVTNISIDSFQNLFGSFMQMFQDSGELSVCRDRSISLYLNDTLRFPNGPYRNLQQLLAAKGLPAYFQQSWEDDYANRSRCDQVRAAFPNKMSRFVQQTLFKLFNGVQIIIMPTTDKFPPRLSEAQEQVSGALLASFVGWPSVNLPAGFSSAKPGAPKGLPMGMVMISQPENEDVLYRVAYSYQQKYCRIEIPTAVDGASETKAAGCTILLSFIAFITVICKVTL